MNVLGEAEAAELVLLLHAAEDAEARVDDLEGGQVGPDVPAQSFHSEHLDKVVVGLDELLDGGVDEVEVPLLDALLTPVQQLPNREIPPQLVRLPQQPPALSSDWRRLIRSAY